jgi:hypothetical protein
VYRHQRNWGARIRELVYQGLRLVEIENQHLRIGVLAGKGADIVELNVKRHDLDLVWLAPGGVRDPLTHAVTAPSSSATFRENYPGGWQEMFPNAGPSSSVFDVSHGQHGEVFNRAWDVAIVEDSDQRVAVRFTIETRTVPCRIEKTYTLDSRRNGFGLEERLVNLSDERFPVMWGHHITFGAPFLVPGSQVTLPDGITVTPQFAPVVENNRRVSSTEEFPWPIDPGNLLDFGVMPQPGTPTEMLFLSGFRNRAWYEIARPDELPGCRVSWDGEQMPWLWYWQEFGGARTYPWYGRLYCIGLEPCSSMPGGIANAVGTQSALWIEPHQERRFWLELEVLE